MYPNWLCSANLAPVKPAVLKSAVPRLLGPSATCCVPCFCFNCQIMEIRDAIREDRCCQVCLLNYRKDGSTFLNQFFLSPIKVGA
jgi:hypothetical protein